MSLANDIAAFTTLVSDWALKSSELYYSDAAQDITVKMINAQGDIVDITLPNHKKMSLAFDTWRGQIDLKNVDGVIKDDAGNAVSVDKFGGMTLEEYNTMYKTFIDKSSIKLVPDSKGSQMVGYQMMAVVTQDNRVLAWGMSTGGMLSYGENTNPAALFELQQPLEKKGHLITKVYVSGQHLGILYDDGDLYLRGLQAQGHFGIGNTATQVEFVYSASSVVEYITSSNGDQDEQPSAAYIDTAGNVWRCGDNGNGELGDGTTTERHTWVKVYDAVVRDDKAKKAVVNGDDAACFYVLSEAGKLLVSGYNGYGQLGNGTTTSLSALTQIVPNIGSSKIVDVVAGGYYDSTYSGSTFILTDDGRVYSCGYNAQGQLGVGDTAQKNSFVQVTYATGHDVVTDPIESIYTVLRTSYYLTQSGNLYAVGENNYGQLGDGTTTNSSEYKLTLTNVKKFYPAVGADASQYPFCYVLTNAKEMYSWGQGDYGCMGRYTPLANNPTPLKVNFDRAEKITQFFHSGYANERAIYVLTDEGFIYGCGRNNYGQITISSPQDNYRAEFTRIRI